MEIVGNRIVEFYGLRAQWDYVGDLYHGYYGALAVAVAGFTPIPYKLFTIAAGAFKIDFILFVIASVLSRSARFFLVAGLIFYFGAKVKRLIDKYFDALAFGFTAMLVGGFVAVKYFF
jgi:membrane protein YqaA with SNARE-associated domain